MKHVRKALTVRIVLHPAPEMLTGIRYLRRGRRATGKPPGLPSLVRLSPDMRDSA